jgi:site-specific DNA recombinase
MKLAGYCRVSTDNQKDDGTIQIQERALEEYCKKNNHELIAIYKDEGISGDVENRRGLSSLITFLECSRGIDGVLIFKLDRLARDLYMQEHLIKEFTKLSVNIYSTMEPDLNSTDPMRKAFRQLLGIVAELEKSYITMRLTTGRLNKARNGGYAGGGIPLGFRSTTDKDVEIDDIQAATIRLIFRLHRKQLSLHEIARYLNKTGYETARGGQWYAGTVKYIVENPRYKGRWHYKDELSKRNDLVLTGRRQVTNV